MGLTEDSYKKCITKYVFNIKVRSIRATKQMCYSQLYCLTETETLARCYFCDRSKNDSKISIS